MNQPAVLSSTDDLLLRHIDGSVARNGCPSGGYATDIDHR